MERELAFLRRYLEIQQIRFQERLRVTLDVAPDTLDAYVPSLILQPLVENAIRHGIAPRAAGGHVAVRAGRRGDQLRLEVSDDGAGLPDAADATAGLGLANTRARLDQLYADRHEFALRNRESGGLEVVLTIPFRLAAEQAAANERE